MKKFLFTIVLGIISSLAISAQTLKIIGYDGSKYNVFLGELNTNNYSSNSIWNEYGTYGNNYSNESIWNEYSTYGNEYNLYSPWNSSSLNPPMIVDDQEQFYGYLTTNEFLPDRLESPLAEIMCENYTQIQKDVDAWYDKIFE